MNRAVIAETIRRHVSSTGYVLFVVLVAMAGMVAATFNAPASLWPSLVTLLAIITGSGGGQGRAAPERGLSATVFLPRCLPIIMPVPNRGKVN